MKRIISLLLLCLMVVSFAACKKDEAAKEIDIQAVKKDIIEKVGIEKANDIKDEKLLMLYGIEAEDVAESASFTTEGAVFTNEIILLKAKDEEAADRIEDCLKIKLEQVLVQSKNYSAEDYAVYQQIKVLREGDALALFIHGDHKEMQEIFESAK